MRTRSALPIALAVAAYSAATASAQSIYVDLGGASPPSSSYAAAAGVPGYWNLTPNDDTSPPPFAPLLDIHQQPTGASGRSSWCDISSGGVPATDDEALLDDWLYTDCTWNAPQRPTIEVMGLEAGTYQVFVYPIGTGSGPDNVYLTSNGTIEGGNPMYMQNTSVFPGTFADWVIGVALVHVPAGGGYLQLQTWYENGGISGFQLLRLDDATPFCSGHLGDCPCGVGQPGSGCPSSFNAAGATLVGVGSRQVSNDTLQMTASGVTNSGLCILFQGTTALGLGRGVLFGDGLRCAGGPLIRIVSRQAVGGMLLYPLAGDPLISVRGQLPVSGGFRTYQVRYRNAASYCTSDTFNTTNGIAVQWLP